MSIEPELVRLAVYHELADTGRAPTRDALAFNLDSSDDDITTALSALVEDRHLVLGSNGEVELAHPFATRDFGFVVKGAKTLRWGGCAWDAFAIPHLVKSDDTVLVATTCPACNTPTHGTSTTLPLQWGVKSCTSSSRWRRCGTTSSTPAHTNASSATMPA